MNQKNSNYLLMIGCFTMLVGLLFYGVFRPNSYTLLPHFANLQEWRPLFPEFLLGSLPSFLHVLAMGILLAGLNLRFPSKIGCHLPLAWLVINLLFEFGQRLDQSATVVQYLPSFVANYFVYGVFDWSDVGACFLGFFLAIVIVKINPQNILLSTRIRPNKVVKTTLVIALNGLGLFSLMATSYMEPPDFMKPIYMSYDEFRQSFALKPSQEIAKPGKIHVLGELLLVSDINSGIHVINNSDPKNPQPLVFIKILGNRDMAVQNYILYADSFVDMLVIDISNPSEPVLVQRLEEIFPWDPAHWYGRNIDWAETLNPQRGVIIDFEKHGSRTE